MSKNVRRILIKRNGHYYLEVRETFANAEFVGPREWVAHSSIGLPKAIDRARIRNLTYFDIDIPERFVSR